MASSSSTVDAELAQLTPSQREALQQFTAVTDQQPLVALPLLRRCQWNVQVGPELKVFCVAFFFFAYITAYRLQ